MLAGCIPAALHEGAEADDRGLSHAQSVGSVLVEQLQRDEGDQGTALFQGCAGFASQPPTFFVVCGGQGAQRVVRCADYAAMSVATGVPFPLIILGPPNQPSRTELGCHLRRQSQVALQG